MSKNKKTNSLSQFLGSKRGRQFFHVTYSVGAAIVILGALAKITHLPMGNVLLTIGMVVEAFVFFISAFDVDQVDYSEETQSTGGGVLVGTGSGIATSGGSAGSSVGGSGGGVAGGGGITVIGGGATGTSTGGGSSSVAASSGGVGGGVIVTGGGVVGGGHGGSSGNIASGATANSGNATGGSGGFSGSFAGGTFNPSNFSPEYVEQMDSAVRGMSDFGNVMTSLNEMSQNLLNSCQQISASTDDVTGFSANMKTLNENVSNINAVYEAQFKSMADQINTIKYINESLDRIKSLYDNTVMDSNAFKIENERMTRQIQELNKVYARLLQAMNAGGGGYNHGGGYNTGGYNNPEGGGYNPSL